MASKNYDIRAYGYNEAEALQQLVDTITKVAIEENERIEQGIYVSGCEQFTINIGGLQFAFPLNAPQCCALDAFVERLASESGYTIDV